MQNNQLIDQSGIQRQPSAAVHFIGKHLHPVGGISLGDDLEQRISCGLRANEFCPVFQGAYEVGTGRLARAEVQVHWVHPEYGPLLPGAYMAKLEQSDVAYDMSLFIVEAVCRELQTARAHGVEACTVAMGADPSVVLSDRFASDVLSIARAHGVDPNLLEIEVADSEDASRLFALRMLTEELRDMGVGLSYGELGSGRSSLASLATLDVDTVKLASTLMATVPVNQRSCKVMAGVLSLLAALDVRVIVSGVETAAQVRWLAQWPHVLMQGAYVSKPARSVSQLTRHQR